MTASTTPAPQVYTQHIVRQTMPEVLACEDLPSVLLPYQQRVVSAIDVASVVLIEKSRRIGITWGLGAAAVLTAGAARSAGGMDVLYLGYSYDMTREFIDVCAMWAKAFMPAASAVSEFLFEDMTGEGKKEYIQAFRIVFASGYEIVALTSRPRSLRGRQGLVILDEAAFHDNLAEVIKAAMALLIWGGKVVVVSTHDGDQNPFNLLCEEVRKGEKPYTLLKITFDDALADGLYHRICLVTGKVWSLETEAAWREEIYALYGDDAEEELDVIPRHGAGAYIPPALIERVQRPECPVIRWEQPDTWGQVADYLQAAEAREFCEAELLPVLELLPSGRYFAGEDFARSGDLTVLWIARKEQDTRLTPVLELELRNMPYEVQRTIVFYVLERLPGLCGGFFDATGNGDYLAEVAAKRFPVEKVHLSAAWYALVTPRWKAAIEKEATGIPRDVDVYNDHRAVRIVRGVPQIIREEQQAGKGETKGKKRKKRHGDAAIAHLLCFAASLREAGVLPDFATPRTEGLPDLTTDNSLFTDPDSTFMPYNKHRSF